MTLQLIKEKQSCQGKYIKSQEALQKVLNDDQKTKSVLDIKINDPRRQILLKNINFNPIYDHCQQLTITIYGVIFGQEDFDIFFQRFSQFKVLKELYLSFLNRKVQFLDSLLLNLMNIEKITLSLQHFRKIQLKEQYQDKTFFAKDLNINLRNSTFNEDSIKKFADFIGQHKDLQTLILNIDKQCSIEIISKIQQQTNVKLSLQRSNATKQKCDQIIQLVKSNNLQKFQIERQYTKHIMLQEYLIRNDIKIDNYNFNNFDKIPEYFDMSCFTQQDYLLQRELPYFIDLLKEKQKQTTSIKIFTQKKYLRSLFKYMLDIFDQLFDQIQFYHPTFFCLKSLNSSVQKIGKYYWKVEVIKEEEIVCLEHLNQFNSIVYLNFNFEHFGFKTMILSIKRFLLNLKYLMFLQTPKVMPDNKLYEFINLIKQNSQIFLSYFVFKKNIYHLLPIPSQIFYDLYAND